MDLTENKNKYSEDEMIKQLLDVLREIQSSNRFLLKRLNQSESSNSCACSAALKCNQKEIKDLQSKIVELEEALKEKDKNQRELSRRFEALKDRCDFLETSFMAVQTDDSKLRSESLLERQRPYSSDRMKHTSSVAEKDRKFKENDWKRKPDSDQPGVASQTAVPKLSLQDNTTTSDADRTPPVLTENASESSVKKSQGNIVTDGSDSQTMSREQPVEVLMSPERKSYGDEQFWRLLARQEVKSAQKIFGDLEGVHSVICLDISASMAEGDAWTQAKTFLDDYLKGLDDISMKYGLTDEHVALVTFGHETQVQKRFTNKYIEIRELIGKQKLGGPSPLYGGLAFGLAAAVSSSHAVHEENNVYIFRKIIIVTDGYPTEVGQYAGSDLCTENLDETRAKIIQMMEEYKGSQIDAYCVPVGNADKTFLEVMLNVAGGRMLNFESGKQLSKRRYLATKIRNPLGLVDPLGLFSDSASFLVEGESYLSADDKRIVDEIISDSRKHILSGIRRTKQHMYREIPGKNLAPIGSRVRRGPDWNWDTQDSHGPGTVIGHDDGNQVWVEWDVDAHQNVYRYGPGGYDVLIVEEPRELKPGQKIAVGCLVKHVTKGQNFQKGTVIKLDESNEKATVRWQDGRSEKYSYGGTGKSEIEVYAGFQPFSSQGYVLGYGESASPMEKRTTKNKNKNIH